METFSALLAICAGNSPVPGEFPAQRPVTRSFDVFFDLRPNKRLCKQPWGWWFETLSWSLWRHRNDVATNNINDSCNRQRCYIFFEFKWPSKHNEQTVNGYCSRHSTKTVMYPGPADMQKSRGLDHSMINSMWGNKNFQRWPPSGCTCNKDCRQCPFSVSLKQWADGNLSKIVRTRPFL